MKLTFVFSLFALVILFVFAVPIQAQWMQVSGSYGGRTNCIAVSGNELFAGTVNGVFRSTNNGVSWIAINSGLASSITSLAVEGSNIFAGTNNAGVYRMAKNETNWSPVNNGLTSLNVLVLMSDSINLFAGTGLGIFRSTDNGSNWSLVDTNLKSINSFTFSSDGSGNKYIFAASRLGIDRSIDSGETWANICKGGAFYDPATDGWIFKYFYSLTANDSTIFAGGGRSVFRSTDQGLTWTEHSVGYSTYNNISCLVANGRNVFASDGADLYHSTDNGITWVRKSWTNSGLPRNAYGTQTIYSLTLSGSTLFACTDAGILNSTDNADHWIPLNNGLNISTTYSLAASGSNIYASIGGGYSLCRSTDNGSNWVVLNDTVFYHYRSIAVNGLHVVAGTDGPFRNAGNSYALRSSDNGSSWRTDWTYGLATGIAPVASNAHSFGINNTYFFAAIPYGGSLYSFYRCHIDSSRWYLIPTNTSDWGSDRLSLLVNGSNIYVGSERAGIYYSYNDGENWSTINTGLDIETSAFTSLAINGSNIFAGTSTIPDRTTYTKKGIFRSTDNGMSWSAVNNGLPIANIADIAISGSVVLAATDSNGIYLSRNNGASWIDFNSGLPNPYISSLALNDNYAYAGLLGGIWRRPLSELVSVEEANPALPKDYSLKQNYPNPFNPTTNFEYQIPIVGTQYIVSLRIYDLLGREVATLVNEQKPAGIYSLQWNAEGLSSGIYFYQLQAGAFTETKKLILLR